MNYFKILLLLITFSSISNAAVLTNMFLLENKNRCIYNDFYYAYDSAALKYKFYYRYAGKTNFNSTVTLKFERYTYSGFEYDTLTGRCERTVAVKNGLTNEMYNFLLAFIGLLFGGIFMFFSISAFTNVGGKR